MKRVYHQLVHTLSYGDAISGEVLSLRRALRQHGIVSEIYAINVHPRLKGEALDYRELPDDFSGDLILHYSLGSPLNDLYRSLCKARRTLIYHNLTPPHWFESVNPVIFQNVTRGLKELPELCKVSDILLADSPFNASELGKLGFKADVLELPLDPERWNLATDNGIAQALKAAPGIHLLHVGRLAPNKCIEDIIKTFYFLHHHFCKDSRLWLAGIDTDTELYGFELRRLACELRVDHAVEFTGGLSDSQLKALYENSTFYLCMSEHEGFCLPLVEAMHFRLPVIAYASSAIPDTMADAGVLLHEKHHAEIAALIYRIYKDNRLYSRLQEAGAEREKQLSYQRFVEQVAQYFISDCGLKSASAAGGAALN
ncbi:MAG: glycosyltransferase [Candidatus Dadabacteria bacterium]|nr:MAG: glycosyltransferase [Candidatus Dadabacteria bacterium]